MCVCACARLSGPFYRSKPKTCPWRKKKKKKATCHDSARHGRTWLYRSVHKQSVLELLKQSLQPPATKVSDKNKHMRGASEQRGGKWNQGLQGGRKISEKFEALKGMNVWALEALVKMLLVQMCGFLNAQVNNWAMVTHCCWPVRYLVPRRVSRECVCVRKGNLVWLSLCQMANRGIFLKSTLGCGLQWAHAKRGAKKLQLKCVLTRTTGTPSIPPEQILKETSLPANLILKHSRACTNKGNT